MNPRPISFWEAFVIATYVLIVTDQLPKWSIIAPVLIMAWTWLLALGEKWSEEDERMKKLEDSGE
jgi:hypothetical protein